MDRHLALSRARAFRAFVGHLQPSLLLSSSSCFSYKCRTFQDYDLDSVRELFTIGMGMYTEGKSKETSSLYKFWWDYINGALAADLASDNPHIHFVFLKKGGNSRTLMGCTKPMYTRASVHPTSVLLGSVASHLFRFLLTCNIPMTIHHDRPTQRQ